jgi:polyisoprenoid-binding protein YceI
MTNTETPIAQETITGDYTLDLAHTRIGFSARHAMVTKVRGQFNEFNGSAHLDTEHPANSKVDITIKVASIDTRNADRDAHLRTNDFLAMEEFPEITFRSTGVDQAGDNKFDVTGDLTIRGVSKPVTINFELNGGTQDPWGNFRVGFDGTASINRKDWGVNWNAALEAGGVMVSDKINLEFEVEAVKVKPEA